jgi:hypothetical protein
MKHTFPGGITATANDAAGAEFLRGMIRQPDLEDGPTPQERELRQLRDDLRKAMNVIRALIIEAGETVTISDRSMAEAYGKDLIEHRDECARGHKLSVR